MAGTQLLKKPVSVGPGRRARHVLEAFARRHRAVRARGEHGAARHPPAERVPEAQTAAAVSARQQAAALLAMVDLAGEPDARTFGPCSSSED